MWSFRATRKGSLRIVELSISMVQPSRKITSCSQRSTSNGMPLAPEAISEENSCRHRTLMTCGAIKSILSLKSQMNARQSSPLSQQDKTFGVKTTSFFQPTHLLESHTPSTGFGTGLQPQELKTCQTASWRLTPLVWTLISQPRTPRRPIRLPPQTMPRTWLLTKLQSLAT